MRIKIAVLLGIVAVATGWVRLRSDGSEILGTPSITIASGTGVVSGGTGMVAQPGSITLDVPAGAVVKQVLLYWEGFSTDGSGDDLHHRGQGRTIDSGHWNSHRGSNSYHPWYGRIDLPCGHHVAGTRAGGLEHADVGRTLVQRRQ